MEKRRDHRIKRKIPIRYYFEGNAYLSFTGDVSRRGVFIQTPRPCPAGKGINIEIEAKDERIILAGYIVWSKKDMKQPALFFPGGMGVQVLNYQKEGFQSLVGKKN
jgi:Tfp pilus assembly protein PilZ